MGEAVTPLILGIGPIQKHDAFAPACHEAGVQTPIRRGEFERAATGTQPVSNRVQAEPRKADDRKWQRKSNRLTQVTREIWWWTARASPEIARGLVGPERCHGSSPPFRVVILEVTRSRQERIVVAMHCR